MSKKPRQKHLSKIWVRQEDKRNHKDDLKQIEYEQDDIFANISMHDVMQGFSNRGNNKRFSQHKYRQRMG